MTKTQQRQLRPRKVVLVQHVAIEATAAAAAAAFCDLVVGWMVYVALGIGLGARGMGAT